MTDGHGRPQVRKWDFWSLVIACALISGARLGHAQTESEQVRCELRIVWGGEVPRSIKATIAIDSGSLLPVRNLILAERSNAAIRRDDPQMVSILPQAPGRFGGLDLQVQGTLSSRLTIRVEDPLGNEPVEFQPELSELLQTTWLKPLGATGFRVAIERQLHDKLHIEMDREQAIFDTGEQWSVEVWGNLTGLPAGSYTLEMLLQNSDGISEEVQQRPVEISNDGSFPTQHFDLHAPSVEGAYHLLASVKRRNYLGSLVSSSKALVRRLDLVTVKPSAAPSGELTWIPLARIDPWQASQVGARSWMSWLDVGSGLGLASRLAAADRWQSHNPLAASLQQPQWHGEIFQRAADVSLDDNPSVDSATQTPIKETVPCLGLAAGAWLELPLTQLEAGKLHRLRIRVPSDRPMKLYASVQQVTEGRPGPGPLSIDSGLTISPRQVTTSGKLAVQEVLFWPSTEQVRLVLASAEGDVPASVYDVWLDRSEVPPAVPDSDLAAETDAAQPVEPQAWRMLGLCVDKPLLADGVFAVREVDPLTGRRLETWRTWHESVVRIEQLMQLHSANTLLIKGFSDGGAIFPSPRLQPSRRYDSGTFFADGRSLEIKDAIELILRHFDRSGKRLILALELDMPLPGVERLGTPRDDDESLWQQPISSTQLSRNDDGQGASNSWRYNPLDKRVQEEVAAVVREIAGRYGGHRSFAGIAIQLDNRSQLLFAGDRWGYDPETLRRFAESAEFKLPPRDQWPEVFSGPARLAFLNWRAAELTRFYARLGASVAEQSAGGKLYLNPIRLWDSFPSTENFYKPDSIIRNPGEYLLAFGIAAEHLRSVSHVELMRGSQETPADSVNSKDWLRRESGLRGLAEIGTGTESAALVMRYPQLGELAEATTPSTPSSEAIQVQRTIYPTLLEPALHARRRLTNQLFYSDSLLLLDGSWLPLACYDHQLAATFRTLGELPPVKLTDLLDVKDRNLRVRGGKYQGKYYLQIVNHASWPEHVELSTRGLGTSSQVHVLGTRQVNFTYSAGDGQLRLIAEPYAIIALEISEANFAVGQIRHGPPADNVRALAGELNELEEYIAQLADPTQQPPLANLGGDFEDWSDDGLPPGWSVSTLPQVRIRRSEELPHSGRASVLIESQAAKDVSAWIQSRAIEPPATGRLEVVAWLRAPAVGQPLLVRLTVIGRTVTGERFEHALTTGQRSPSGVAVPIDWGRRPYSLHVGNLDAEQIRELYISVELIGPGKVWVDDVEVLQSVLQPDERNHLRGQLLVAKQRLSENNPYPAEQLLESHWACYLDRMRRQALQPVSLISARKSDSISASPQSDERDVGNEATESDSSASNNWSQSPSVLRKLRESVRSRWRR